MSLLNMAADIFLNQLGGKGEGLDLQKVMGGLKSLLPTEGGDLDIPALLNMVTQQGGGLAAAAQSWLGDGANQSLGSQDVKSLLGEDKVAQFGSQIGVETDTAAEGLAGMLPKLLDKSSEGGSLLSGVVSSGAGSLLKGLF
ncbi:YidB family protein [uncultured Gilvimarinus sp.]|uniref:YidB family protein n=1 Tax=uncultured Gilvimarinus sp. TaxID=1689143 RepID=UPI0030ED70C6|tara:strand:+ start:4319 stop:4741 length:423 start_codon:yes stop_codon:yes gene_type:complete